MIIREEAMNTLIDICDTPPEPTDALKQLLQGDDILNEIKLNRQPLENTYDGFEQADIFMGCKYNPRKCLACGEEHGYVGSNLPCPNFILTEGDIT